MNFPRFSYSLILSSSLSLSHTLICSLSHSYALSLTHMLSLSFRTQTQLLFIKHSLTSLTITCILSFSLSLSLLWTFLGSLTHKFSLPVSLSLVASKLVLITNWISSFLFASQNCAKPILNKHFNFLIQRRMIIYLKKSLIGIPKMIWNKNEI